MKKTVSAMLAAAATDFADRPYLHRRTDDGWRATTFAEARRLSRAVAGWLGQSGIKPGDRCAILAEGSPEWVLFELGCVLARGISVPLSIRLQPEELLFRINHAGARFLAVTVQTLPRVLSVAGGFDRMPTLVLLDEDDGFAGTEGARDNPGGVGIIPFSTVLSEGGLADPAGLDALEAAIAEDDVVTISYTSGTTGNPKGIMLTHRNYHANTTDAVEMFQVPLNYSTLVILPCDHSFAHTVGLYCALWRGISLYFVDPRGRPSGMVRSIPTNLKEANPVFLLTVPALSGSFMEKIQDGVAGKGGIVKALFDLGIRSGIAFHGDGYNRQGIFRRSLAWLPYRVVDALLFSRIRRTFGSRIKFFVSGGALLEVGQQEFFMALGIPVYQGYGLTEAAPVISSNAPGAHKLGTSGRIAPSVSCRIERSGGRFAGIGEVGEISVQGPNVMKGYFNNDTATAETLRGGWLHTGDLGFIDEDGFLVVSGREKALLISSNGEKYSPEEIEEAIMTGSPLIHRVVLYNDHRKYTSALVVLEEQAVKRFVTQYEISDPRVLAARLAEEVHAFKRDPRYARRFPPEWLPTTFRILPEAFTDRNLMLNSTMKVVRHRVLEAYADDIEYMYTAEGALPLNPRNTATLASLYF